MIRRTLALTTFTALCTLFSTHVSAQDAEVLISDEQSSDTRAYSALFKTRHGNHTQVTFEQVDGYGVTEGDILLGQINTLASDGNTGLISKGLSTNSLGELWENGIMRYQISPDVSANIAERIDAAFVHWAEQTSLGHEKLDYQVNQTGDYVEFVSAAGCASYVGKIGGRQEVWVNSRCTTGNIIHEIGHAYGLYHEHTRPDRDSYITVNTANIQAGKDFNFEIQRFGSQMVGNYDYDSIMHYGSHFFANDRTQPTIIAPQAIGQRIGLSPGDINAINSLYSMGLQFDLALADTLIEPETRFTLQLNINNKSGESLSGMRLEIPLNGLRLDTTALDSHETSPLETDASAPWPAAQTAFTKGANTDANTLPRSGSNPPLNTDFSADNSRWQCQHSSIGISCQQTSPLAAGELSAVQVALRTPTAAQVDPRWPLEELAPVLYTADGQTKTTSTAIVVNSENFAPRVTQGLVFSLQPNSANGTLLGQIEAQDWNRDAVTLSLGGGNLGGQFALNPDTGELRVNNAAALPADGSSVILTVVAHDGQLYSDPTDVLIRIDSRAVSTSAAANQGGSAGSLSLLSLSALALISLLASALKRLAPATP